MTSLIITITVFSFIASITPGPNNVLLLASGINFGFARTVPHIIGITVGVTAMIALAGLGMGEIVTWFPQFEGVLRILGAVYFLYLAYKVCLSGTFSGEKALPQPFSALDGALFQLINPKAWLFATAVSTTYVSEEHGYYGVTIAALVFAVVNFPSIAVWAAFGSMLRPILGNHVAMRIVNFVMALMVLGSVYIILFPL